MLETVDLILRPGREADCDSIYANLWSQAEAFRYLFSKPSADAEAARKKTLAYIGMQQEVKTEYFVCEKETDEVIGIAGIKEMHPGVWTVTDIAIGPAFWGRGFGKQILGALLHQAFDTCGAEEVLYNCFAENTASKALARSCGFVFSHSEAAELKKNGDAVILEYYRNVNCGSVF